MHNKEMIAEGKSLRELIDQKPIIDFLTRLCFEGKVGADEPL